MKEKIFNRLFGMLQWLRAKFFEAQSTGHSIGSVKKIQPVLLLGDGVVEFENNVRLGFFPSPFFFSGYIHREARGKGSSIRFGEGTHVNNNFVAIAEHATITIGKRCLVGTNVEVYDSDFHGIRVSDRRTSNPAAAKSVVIEDDVFIGSNVKILKGVKIGVGSVIANGSIVVGEIPPGVIAGGNPARILKAIVE